MRKEDSASPWATNFREYSLYASDFGHKMLKYEENSKLFWRYKETQRGGLEWDKGRFTTIVTTIYKCNCFIHLAYFRLVRYNKVFESKDAMRIQDNWNIFEKRSAEKNCHSLVSDMMKKLYIPLFLY